MLPAVLGFFLFAAAIAAPPHALALTTVAVPDQSDWTGTGPPVEPTNFALGRYSPPPPVNSITVGANKSSEFSGGRRDNSVTPSGHGSLLFAPLEAVPSLEMRRDPADGATGFDLGVNRVFDPDTGDVNVDLESFQAHFSFPDASANPELPDGARCVNILELRDSDFPSTDQDFIDNTLGTADFGRSNSNGVPLPANLGHALTRLNGSVNQECRLDIEMASLGDVEGNQIAIPTGLNRALRRGDATADGSVNVADALFIAQHLAGLRDGCTTEISTNCLHSVNSASVKHDGPFDQVTMDDARSIAENLVGLRDGFYNPGPPKVDIFVLPDRSSVKVGEQIDINVKVFAAAAGRVDAAQVYLDFNPSVLQVLALTGGTALPAQFQSKFDNGLGQIAYAAGNGIGTPIDSVASPFDLVKVTFQAVAASGQGGTDIAFSPLLPPRESKTIFGVGLANTGQLLPINILVTPEEGPATP
jgi:hypothetical protein